MVKFNELERRVDIIFFSLPSDRSTLIGVNPPHRLSEVRFDVPIAGARNCPLRQIPCRIGMVKIDRRDTQTFADNRGLES